MNKSAIFHAMYAIETTASVMSTRRRKVQSEAGAYATRVTRLSDLAHRHTAALSTGRTMLVRSKYSRALANPKAGCCNDAIQVVHVGSDGHRATRLVSPYGDAYAFGPIDRAHCASRALCRIAPE
jgi:hypothetical protein